MIDDLPLAQAQKRVAVLRAAYHHAVAEVEVASQELRDVELPFPDGQQKYRNALVAERKALEAYTDAERDLVALLMRRDD